MYIDCVCTKMDFRLVVPMVEETLNEVTRNLCVVISVLLLELSLTATRLHCLLKTDNNNCITWVDPLHVVMHVDSQQLLVNYPVYTARQISTTEFIC